MKYSQHIWDDIFVKIKWSFYKPKKGDAEFYAVAEILKHSLSGQEQFCNIEKAIEQLKEMDEFKKVVLVWKRYFVSDAANQYDWFKSTSDLAVSIIQQPPLNCTKLVLLVYGVENAAVSIENDGTFVMNRPYYTHLYNLQLQEKTGTSYEQTQVIFNRFIKSLSGHNSKLAGNCLRTWLFVKNIDQQYEGMVRARREIFTSEGLTPQTHYIASTGIEGQSIHPEVSVMMDAYSIKEIKPEQILFLHAYTHLNPTHEYGVTFERGTSIQFGDRKHILISGTASIDNQGKIVHPLQIEKQTERTIENINALLTEAGAGWLDVTHLIVYLRDIADYENTSSYFEENFPEIPFTVLLAPVCRPGWLIEVECSAVKEVGDGRFEVF